MNEKELAQEILRKSRRCRTGILLTKTAWLGKESEIAVMAGMDYIDFAELLVDELPSGSRYVNITASKLFDKINDLAIRVKGGDVMLVYNLDLPLAKLEIQDRLQLWRNLRDNLSYKQRALVFLLPETAKHLLPTEDELIEWEKEQRLAVTE